jgi:hypothetical protein
MLLSWVFFFDSILFSLFSSFRDAEITPLQPQEDTCVPFPSPPLSDAGAPKQRFSKLKRAFAGRVSHFSALNLLAQPRAAVSPAPRAAITPVSHFLAVARPLPPCRARHRLSHGHHCP